METSNLEILLSAWPVKGIIAFENRLGFLAQIEDLHLKCGIPAGRKGTLFINILFLSDFGEGLRTKEELAGRLSIGISIGELNRRMGDELG